jgi:hypothetical protein
MRHITFTLAILLILFACSGHANETRRSGSGICHEKGQSPYFDKTSSKHTFSSVEACLASTPGARLPKGVSTSSIDKATKEADQEGRAYSKLYNRKDWPHWRRNVDGCMNARHALLKAQSLVPVSGTKCTVKTGKWLGPYTNKYYTLASDVDIDHVVPLAAAHRMGGYAWTRSQREKFANDPENLLITDDSANQSKSDQTPATWMPPYKSYRCQYLAHFDRIVVKYNLKYLASEKRTINKMKRACNLN